MNWLTAKADTRGGTIWLDIGAGIQKSKEKGLGLPVFLATITLATYPHPGYWHGSQQKMVSTFENAQLKRGKGQGYAAAFHWVSKVQGLSPGPPEVSGTTLVHRVRLTTRLSHQGPIAVFQKQQPLRRVLTYWIKNVQLQVKEKKKHSRVEVPLVFEGTGLQKYIVSLSKTLFIGKLLPTPCYSIKLIPCDCSHWNCKNFHSIKGMYKSLHDLSHRYKTLQPGKYKQ